MKEGERQENHHTSTRYHYGLGSGGWAGGMGVVWAGVLVSPTQKTSHRGKTYPFPIRRIHFAQHVFPSMLFFVSLFSAPYAFMAFIVMRMLIHSG